ncbi:MAG: HD domain-containing protein [Treponema porcinum]|uniref:HD domain-containing protein n=1 Tax=Treponema porcinum TaxID=261392 RepID=UPI002352DB26|nr:HD domain-containing protein [Treponema porcinum]MCI6179934.1 HD domain-containing protein [Treponema porcinum]MCI6322439.1 HD domain-containing protein [Treponema porcinum]MCI6480779.1 HD domain-containing protein [Treponema porcinum]MCI6984119.1 HD domain-containing protein [Treponema porcinum]MCI7079482.1 HD domain-containing protein [Treponema porcinum]
MLTQKFALKIFEGFSIQRWTDLIRPFDIVEMDKAGEKMVLAYIIGKCEEQKGVFVDWTWMIYASLFDILKKIALCDIKAPIQQILKKDYASEYLRLNEWILNQYKPLIDDSALFSQFTIYEGQRAGTFDIPEKSRAAERILSAANKFATMRELQMLSIVNEPERLEKINKELLADLQGYLDLTGLQLLMTRQKSYDFIMKIEQLRFQTRWNQTPRVPKTSVLGHCFFVAVITLLLCRQSGQKMCEKRLINNYFSALFHDLPEAVTRDIISPVKQATDELPSIVKRIEDEIVNKELVPLMEPYFSDELMYFTSDEFSNRIKDKKGNAEVVSWEDLNGKYNQDDFSPVDGRTVRIADHLSALLEADSSIKHGITSNHLEYGRNSMISHYKPGETINGIDVGKLFREIIGE